MRIALIGATGMVGGIMLKVLEEMKFDYSEIILVASKNSIGKEVDFDGATHKIISIQDAVNLAPDIALFSAGGSTSQKWAPEFAKVNTVVIDNSSYWRMDENIKLIVPEINGDSLTQNDKIIANPNCSTIQLVLAMKPLHEKYKIKRVVLSTYQSVTGTGVKAYTQLENERSGLIGEMAYPYKIDQNCIPHCDEFTENGYTKEEMKLTNETKKILDPNINVSATAVRVPVIGGHSEAVNIEFEKDFELSEVRMLLQGQEGVTLKDDPTTNTYPMPLYAQGKNDVFVGRIRRDESQEKTLNMWIVSDNLRKGAATNAVQIAQLLIKKEFFKTC
ncbi:MAG: aspartate-semialdehyde dehydrogenase [Crocinitomicaceae bacterium]|nr:aspartate-semialdehyde dehydrogenase [Crocinitomicaceae bacterium]|tara:strand:- start:17215 stop:18210 length:996 start_codon:yes stop_codon:yes gene_type:complete